MSKDKGTGGGEGTPHAHRSNTLNPNNPAFKAAADNRSNQLNPNNPIYQGDD